MPKVKSPISMSNTASRKVTTFKVNDIVDDYKKLNLNVSRFFKSIDEIELYECQTTGYRFYYPFSTIGDAQFYKELSEISSNYYSSRWEHSEALKHISADDNVLEIGSGFGAFLLMLKENNIIAEGIELNKTAIKRCQEKGLEIHSQLINEFSANNRNAADVVCYFQVLEHINEVYDFIKSSLETLKTDGKLIIGVPNNNPYLFRFDKFHTLNLPPHHAGLWNYQSLKALEKIFPIKMVHHAYEPLEKSYRFFLKVQLKHSNFIFKQFLKFCNKFFPNLLRRSVCKYYNGRNILVIFRKV